MLNLVGVLDPAAVERRAVAVFDLELAPVRGDARVEREPVAPLREPDQRFQGGAVEPRGGAGVPRPAAAADVWREAVHVGRDDVRLDLVAGDAVGCVGVRSSNHARKYQPPSQACASTATRSCLASERRRSAVWPSPRAPASAANSVRTSTWNHATQTLSPLPPAPTRFIPSFQSPHPI